jgi:SET domain-containing protein 6
MLLRALCASENDRSAWKKPKDAITIEETALLQSVLTKRLSEYMTSTEVDQALVKAMQAGSGEVQVPSHCNPRRYFMAVQVRLGEKEIIQQLISMCQHNIQQKSEEIAREATNGASKRKHVGDSGPPSKRATGKKENRR